MDWVLHQYIVIKLNYSIDVEFFSRVL